MLRLIYSNQKDLLDVMLLLLNLNKYEVTNYLVCWVITIHQIFFYLKEILLMQFYIS